MDSIKVAIQRAKLAKQQLDGDVHPPEPIPLPQVTKANAANVVALDLRHLHDMRIVAHDATLRPTASYDMLRTHVLQGLQELSYKTLAITSPHPGCGKTVTAINLAFSVARQLDQKVLVVDLDLRKPQIARYLGFRPERDLSDLLAGTCTVGDALVTPNLVARRLSILPLSNPVNQPSEQLASLRMKELVMSLKEKEAFSTIIFDLPPMLSSDDFLVFLPQVDCALLVAEVGRTSARELRECQRLIDDHKFFGCLLNKGHVPKDRGYYYGGN